MRRNDSNQVLFSDSSYNVHDCYLILAERSQQNAQVNDGCYKQLFGTGKIPGTPELRSLN